MIVKKCKYCGKTFISKSDKKNFCSKDCRKEHVQAIRDAESQPCWTCKRGVNECEWMQRLKPISGWDATKVITKDAEGKFCTYNIRFCPNYISIREAQR